MKAKRKESNINQQKPKDNKSIVEDVNEKLELLKLKDLKPGERKSKNKAIEFIGSYANKGHKQSNHLLDDLDHEKLMSQKPCTPQTKSGSTLHK